jgi:fumarate reductase subunit C
MIMVPLVFGHLGMMIYAIQGGLTAGEILNRTQHSWFWAAFYGLFVLAVSIHGAIGLRVILAEILTLSRLALDSIMYVAMSGLFALGIYAVIGVTV